MQRNNNEDESNVPSQNNLDEIQNNIFENQNSSNEVIDVDVDSPIKDTSKSTAMIKTRLKVKEKLFEKTKGNRQEEVKSYVKENIAESHLQRTRNESVELAVQLLKINNQIEQKERTLRKFEDAVATDPDLPFIPNSASKFSLAGTDAVKGLEEFKQLSQHMDNLTQKYKKEISNITYAVGKLELEILFETRTRLLVEKGLSLTYAVDLEQVDFEQMFSPGNGSTTPQKRAAIALYAVLATLTNIDIKKYVKASMEKLKELIEEVFRKKGQCEISIAEIGRNMKREEESYFVKLTSRVSAIIETISYEAWNHTIKKQQERIRNSNVIGMFEAMAVTSVTAATEQLLENEKSVSYHTPIPRTAAKKSNKHCW